jgi:hypothetical protein
VSHVDAWKQRGSLYLWRYLDNVRNYPGWHFAATAEGYVSLSSLLKVFSATSTCSYRTLVVTPPTPTILKVPNNRCARWTAPKKWRISFMPELQWSNAWEFSVDNEIVHLSLGSLALPCLVSAVEDGAHGEGDFSINPSGARGSELWIWWLLRAV